LGDGRDLRIRVADGFAEGTAVSGNPRKNARGVASNPKNTVRQILGQT